jgi:hypothetical protein
LIVKLYIDNTIARDDITCVARNSANVVKAAINSIRNEGEFTELVFVSDVFPGYRVTITQE